MNKNDFLEGIKMLQNNYHKQLTSNQLILYYANLKDMNKETYMDNIIKIVQNNKYMPTIAEIRQVEQRKQYSNYEQRDYRNIDFNKYYIN